MSAEPTIRQAPPMRLDGHPVPAGLCPLLRDWSQYARILRSITSHWGAGTAELRAAQQVTRIVIDHGTGDERLVPLLTALLPVCVCRCGRRFLRDTVRRKHCSDACRRAATLARGR